MKLHRRLARRVEELRTSLHPIGKNVPTDIVGSVSYSTPEQWFPRHFTLRQGEARKTTSSKYFFVRAVLDPPEIWVGYAPRREGIQELVADPDALERLARHASKSTRLIAVTPKGQPFEIVREPVELSMPAMREMSDEPKVQRMNFIQVFPIALMGKPGADARIEAALLKMVKARRSAPVLDAP